MRAIVFSGGGAKGAYEAGLIQTLVNECHEGFDIICGTSIGAINASFVAMDRINELATVWKTIGEAGIATPLERTAALEAIYSKAVNIVLKQGLFAKAGAAIQTGIDFVKTLHALSPLETLISMTGALSPVGAQTILAKYLRLKDLTRVLIASATNLTEQKQVPFYAFPAKYATYQEKFLIEEPDAIPFASSSSFSETIRASGGIPGAFSPIPLTVNGVTSSYVDGGVTNNTPIGQAIDAGADDITILYVDPPDTRGRLATDNLAEILLGCFSMMQQRILDLDLQTAMRVNDAVGANATDTATKRIVKVRTFRPKLPLSVGIIDFDKQTLINDAFNMGVADARAGAPYQA